MTDSQEQRVKEGTPEWHLHAIADFVEPHWKGAGCKLESDWIITTLVGWSSEITELGDEVDGLKAEIAAAQARIGRLEKALTPFSELAGIAFMANANNGDPWQVEAGLLFDARAALEATDSEQQVKVAPPSVGDDLIDLSKQMTALVQSHIAYGPVSKMFAAFKDAVETEAARANAILREANEMLRATEAKAHAKLDAAQARIGRLEEALRACDSHVSEEG